MLKLMETLRTFILGQQLQGKSIGIAVSGGSDSMALLHLLNSIKDSLDLDIHALTVDHKLRIEAEAEAAMVATYCKSLSIQHKTLVWDDGPKPATRLQESARKARYALIQDYCAQHQIKHLFLAHHGDDQIETFFQRLFKGSGMRGLAGMSCIFETEGLQLCRPLLFITKNDLLTYCMENEIPFVNDPSNTKDNFERVRIRKALGVLAEHGFETQGISKTLTHLVALNNFLEDEIQHILENITMPEGLAYSKFFALHPYLQQEVLREFLLHLKGSDYPPKYEKITGLIESLNQKKPHTLSGFTWRVKGDAIVYDRESRG